MPRNAEVIRQWQILLHIEKSRRATIDGLAARVKVSTRTIRRDLDALQEAGFPLVDEKIDGTAFWSLLNQPLKALHAAGISLPELCAFYLSRSLVECLAGGPFSANLKSGFDKMTTVLSPHMRAFLDQLPAVFAVRPEPKKRGGTTADTAAVSSLLQATLEHRQVRMSYDSFTSGRVKEYLVEPYRLVYGQGAVYLQAFVPAYTQMRTFAVGRIRTLNMLEEHFRPTEHLSDQPFGNSMGINSGGRPEPVEIAFAPSAARYIREREWHPSQKIREMTDGALVLSMKVCVDWALQSWVLSFGPFARVLKPARFALQIFEELDAAREQYAPQLAFSAADLPFVPAAQRPFPFMATPGTGR